MFGDAAGAKDSIVVENAGYCLSHAVTNHAVSYNTLDNN